MDFAQAILDTVYTLLRIKNEATERGKFPKF